MLSSSRSTVQVEVRKERRDIAFLPSDDRSRIPTTSCHVPVLASSSHSMHSDPAPSRFSTDRLLKTLCDRCRFRTILSSPISSHPARRYPEPKTRNSALRTRRRERRTVDGHVLQLGDSQVGDDGGGDEGSQGSGEL